MNTTVSVKRREVFDITIDGVKFKGLEKCPMWGYHERYVGEDDTFLIFAFFGVGIKPDVGLPVGDLFGDGREMYLLSADSVSMGKLNDAVAREQKQPESPPEQTAA